MTSDQWRQDKNHHSCTELPIAHISPLSLPITLKFTGTVSINKRGYGPVADALTSWFVWCRGPESNWGHEDFQSSALPTELPRHLLQKYPACKCKKWIICNVTSLISQEFFPCPAQNLCPGFFFNHLLTWNREHCVLAASKDATRRFFCWKT